MNISLSAFVPENLVSRDGFGSPVPRQPAHLHTQAESGAYLRDSSRVPPRRPFINLKPPYAIGSVSSLSGHAIAYRWRSLPRVRRHGASKPLGSSERVLPWQVTMDQLIFASFPHPLLVRSGHVEGTGGYTLNNVDSRPRPIAMFEDCYTVIYCMDMHGGGRGVARCRKSIHISPDVYDDVSTG